MFDSIKNILSFKFKYEDEEGLFFDSVLNKNLKWILLTEHGEMNKAL